MSYSIVESVEKYSKEKEPTDSYYLTLKKALDEYHKMIDKGILVPRGNTLQNSYTTVYKLPRGNY